MEVKDLLEVLDLKDIKDVDGFKKAVNEKFISKSQALDDDEIKGKITGKVTGALTTILKREFELSNDEIKDKKWEEIIQTGVTKQKNKIKELEDLSTSGNDEKVKDLTAKLEKATKKADETKALLDTTVQSFTEKEQGYATKFKEVKVSGFFDKAKEKVFPKLKSDLSLAEKLGFETKLKDLTVDFDDKDEVLVLGKDGKRLTNPNKVGTFLSLEEAIELQASELNLIKKNNGATVDVKNLMTPKTETVQPQTNGRQVHPSALKHSEVIKSQSQK
jgi:ribosomal protein L17